MQNKYASQAVIKVGENAKYQKILLVFSTFMSFCITYSLLGCPFIFMNPLFTCSFTDKEVQEDIACPKISECRISTISIDSGNDFTLTAYAELYCDRQTERNIIQSSLFIGSVCGLFLMNMISDMFGRKFAYLISLCTIAFGALYTTIGGYGKSVFMMSLGQLMSGFGGYSAMIVGYIILSDFCSGKTRAMAIIAMNGFWGLAEASFALFYFYLPEWYNFLILILLIPLMCLICLCKMFLVESPIFLTCKKKNHDECMKSLEFMATVNNVGAAQLQEASQLVRKSIEESKKNQSQQKNNQPLTYLKQNKQHIKTIILVAIIQISTNMYYYGVQFQLEDLGSNFGISILLAGTVESLAYFSINLFIGKLKRRKGLLITNLLSAGLGLLFILPFVKNSVVFSCIVLALCRMFNTYSQGFIPLLQTESFPEEIQSTGAGMIEGTSQMGSFITPYIVSLVTNLGQKPIILMSILVLIMGIFPLKFVKETYNEEIYKKQTAEPLLNEEQEENAVN